MRTTHRIRFDVSDWNDDSDKPHRFVVRIQADEDEPIVNIMDDAHERAWTIARTKLGLSDPQVVNSEYLGEVD